MKAINDSRPLPRNQKKSCYNNRCKHLKQFTLESKDLSDASTKFMTLASESVNCQNKMFSKSFFEKQYERDKR